MGKRAKRRAAPRTHHNASIDEGAASVLCAARRGSGSLDELLRSYAVDVPQLRGRSVSRAA